jgi:acetyl esterase
MTEKTILDPQFAPFIKALANAPSISSLPIGKARALWDLSAFGQPEAVADIREFAIPAAGASIAARFYGPSDNPSGLIVYYHGGGWTLGSLDSHDLPLRAFANMTGAAILSIDYRLAPEHPFPAGLEDCYAALVWAKQHQTELVGGAKPLLVAGDSAGGNLAAVVPLLARDRKGPKIDGQLLLYPTIDGRCGTPSFTERADGGLLSSKDMWWFWSTYIADQTQRLDPRASPCLADNHRDLPPAIVVVAEFDPLRDEGLAYAAQLRAAGNEAALLRYGTLPHGFFNSLNIVDAAGAAVREISRHVRQMIANAEAQA